MTDIHYQDSDLFIESLSASAIAEEFGTPCYVYSRAMIEANYLAFEQALEGIDHYICYAVKASSNIAILNLLVKLGSGFDIVSIGELERVLAAGGLAENVVFSGVGKLPHEMREALDSGIRSFNVESRQELLQLESVAQSSGRVAPVSIRVNPDVDALTHPYIATGLQENKFGVSADQVRDVYRIAADSKHLEVVGIDCHIGSQLTDLAPFQDAFEKCIALVDQLQIEDGIDVRHINMGGGLGIRYHDETAPSVDDYASIFKPLLADRSLALLVEPGRRLVAETGLLLTRVQYLKSNSIKHFAIVDAAMNDFIRPALYQAWQEILPARLSNEPELAYDVVGPVCESGDFFARERPLSLKQNDLLAVADCGAYGFAMSSNYNSRNRPAEVMVDGTQAHLIRRRERLADQLELESILPS